MGSVNLVVIVESARSLVTNESDDLKTFHLPSIVAVGAAFGILFHPVRFVSIERFS